MEFFVEFFVDVISTKYVDKKRRQNISTKNVDKKLDKMANATLSEISISEKLLLVVRGTIGSISILQVQLTTLLPIIFAHNIAFRN